MWTALYLYSTPTDDRFKAAAHPCLPLDVTTVPLKQVVEMLCMAHTEKVVLPDDYRTHCSTIEHLKAIALHMGLTVQPLTHYLAARTTAVQPDNNASTVGAAPTTQHAAVEA